MSAAKTEESTANLTPDDEQERQLAQQLNYYFPGWDGMFVARQLFAAGWRLKGEELEKP